MEKLLTIGITSYKRIKELERCINSIKTIYPNDIEIVVSEDHSPLSKEISEMINKINNNSEINIRFFSNEINLGYDRNLGAIIKRSNGKYILFLSDDDALCPKFLDILIEKIKEEKDYGLMYSPFIRFGKLDRNHGKEEILKKSYKTSSKYIYDSILFSGLVFKKENIKNLDAERFLNMNYFQVYMFLYSTSNFDTFYFKEPSILCFEDGENAYGIAESSGGNAILADRKSVKSNLEFNKTLIKVIEMFDKDFNSNIINSFAKQYSFHSYSGLSLARKEGKEYFKEYYRILKNMNIKIYPIVDVYYLILLVFGYKCTNLILGELRSIVKKEKM